ncbi:DegT/DnrJ/EryC1/StrS family aminotransferase [Leptolyngbya cf. ectocarpi LEGE 11479]|uniref:DegT/DnrJ/EryC1/StrS family aminotransferase n=1 Tax=Leptolyngbya cf. ectocarpi LEGE 11479 TaxID=1828722 RepID=A0A929A0A7_LEPEC|nr:DegT/DnrJ/EryC1/StrS family aminotransferase [Leptolyngbya ectocarpi]MBE9070681.1 DegT/DnrJ/EryC1/StrS family aminotransferase [Leptolyngbya cf. ectocarpi LEGE 11479]
MSQINIPILDLKPQYQAIKAEVQAAINQVLDSGQFILGPIVQSFESDVASYLGVKHAIGVNSGTDALVIGLRAMGILPGDEVITTPFSFFATAESISMVGAKPVFVDIQPDTFNIDPNLIEAAITPKTKAIMPVHLYGNPAAMAQIMEIAAKHDLNVIEDCAQAFGAVYKGDCTGCSCGEANREQLLGSYVGTIGHVGAFSFFPTKNLGAYGDGGLITTNDDDIAEAARMLRVHGAKERYHNLMLGYNSRLDAMQAAILQVKLRYVDEWNSKRCWVADTYTQLLNDTDGVITPKPSSGHVFHQYTVRVRAGRNRVRQELLASGIGAMIYYPIPQDKLPIYIGQYPDLPVNNQLAQEVLSLPMWPELSLTQIKQVVSCLQQAV